MSASWLLTSWFRRCAASCILGDCEGGRGGEGREGEGRGGERREEEGRGGERRGEEGRGGKGREGGEGRGEEGRGGKGGRGEGRRGEGREGGGEGRVKVSTEVDKLVLKLCDKRGIYITLQFSS